jgi:isoleucyl-tRNA synthetase
LLEGEYEITMVAAAENSASAVGLTATGFVLLNTEITKELSDEGLARDAVRHVQQARKDAGLDVSDRIILTLSADEQSVAALTKHQELIAAETLAVKLFIEPATGGEFSVGEDGSMAIEIEKAV